MPHKRYIDQTSNTLVTINDVGQVHDITRFTRTNQPLASNWIADADIRLSINGKLYSLTDDTTATRGAMQPGV